MTINFGQRDGIDYFGGNDAAIAFASIWGDTLESLSYQEKLAVVAFLATAALHAERDISFASEYELGRDVYNGLRLPVKTSLIRMDEDCEMADAIAVCQAALANLDQEPAPDSHI